MDDNLKQRHETSIEELGGVKILKKNYKPGSDSLRNETSWLTSNLLQTTNSFKVPNVLGSSSIEGYLNLEYIEEVDVEPEIGTKIEIIIDIASELHYILRNNRPLHRVGVINNSDYKEYLKNYVGKKVNLTMDGFKVGDKILKWVENNIDEYKITDYGICHRDLRLRHLLFGEGKPTLIDWEFSNISETAQDLAKLIFDLSVNYGMEFEEAFSLVIDKYSENNQLSKDLLINKVKVFLPIIPLEHTASFVQRKPEGYQDAVNIDLIYINKIYESMK